MTLLHCIALQLTWAGSGAGPGVVGAGPDGGAVVAEDVRTSSSHRGTSCRSRMADRVFRLPFSEKNSKILRYINYLVVHWLSVSGDHGSNSSGGEKNFLFCLVVSIDYVEHIIVFMHKNN